MNLKKLLAKIVARPVLPPEPQPQPPPVPKVTANIVSLAPSELLSGRRALITGGTSGIGFAIARAFLQSGASVVITGRSEEKLARALEELQTVAPESSRITGQKMDNADIAAMSSCFDSIVEKAGRIDILVNNAGVSSLSMPHLQEADYDLAMNTNLKGAVFLSQMVARYMTAHSIRGNILNIASASSLRPAVSPYILSKWGIRALTLGLAKALIPHGIVVNGIAPGPTATPMLSKNDNSDIGLPVNPIGRYVTPEEVANMAVILTSAAGASIVGDIVYMTGGAGLITLDDVGYGF